jgi:DNA topoisomerase-1
MKKIVSKFPKQNILIATDDDREGEGIAWHLCIVLDLDIAITKRIIFREITKAAIISAVQNPTFINMPLVNAQTCRQVLDMIVGYKISPVLWKYLYNNSKAALSAGRCQTPALRLVYDREKEGLEKQVKLVYKTVGSFFNKNITDGILFELNKEFERIEEIEDFLSKSVNFPYVISLDKKISKKSEPPKPFNTSNLLQRVSSQLHYSPKETMQLCQQLYQEGHITYMRTDAVCYSETFLSESREYIQMTYGKDSVGDFSKIINTSAGSEGGETPHEAIRVTHIDTSSITSENTKIVTLYRLIWRNTVESCMTDYRYTMQKVNITAPLKLEYHYHIETPIFMGWKEVENLKKQENIKKQEKSSSLEFYIQSLIKAADKNFTYNFIKSTVSLRGLERHYTEATLIKELEERGIGRPSTFATIVDTIQDRGYVKRTDVPGKLYNITEYTLKGNELEAEESEKEYGKETNKLVLQNIGSLVCEFLITHFPELFSYDYTRKLEAELDEIADINKSKREPWYKTCIDCAVEIDRQLSSMTIQKQQYRIDNSHILVYEKYGPVIKVIGEKSIKPQYISIKKDIELDIAKLIRGEYTLEELIEIKERSLGNYVCSNNNNDNKNNTIVEIILKSGRYGYYIEYTDSGKTIKKSVEEIIKKSGKSAESLELIDIQEILEGEESKGEDSEELEKNNKNNPNMIRELTNNISIRKGKYGAYIFYKRLDMEKPEFYTLKGFRGYTTCKEETILEWIKTTHKIK